MLTGLKQMVARIRAFFRASYLDRDFDAEFESHAALLAEDHIRRGMTPDQAERSARLELGGLTQLREAHREIRGIPFIETLLQDMRYTLRTLRRDAGFTTFAILIVGLGIGASSTIFSVVSALLIRPLPFRDPGRLVWIANDGNEGDLSAQTVPVGPFIDLRDHNQSLSDIAAYYAFYGVGDSKMTGDGEPERLSAVPVSQNLFPLLGVQPQLGRSFTAGECQANDPVVLLSAGLWKRRFASDPAIVGRKLRLNDRLLTVVGVMPASFDFGSAFAPGSRIDLFVPLPLTPDVDRRGNTLLMIGRLKPGVTVQQAQAEASVLSEPIRVRHNRDDLRFKLGLLEDHVRGPMRPALLVLACAVGVVMLIVCANLSNLQLARTATRKKEMAIRVALGAGSGRLIRQMLTESILLSCCAAVLGLILAVAGTRVLAHLDALSLPLRESVHIDVGALAFTLLIAVLTGLIFGLVPALQVRAGAVHDSLKDANRGSSEGRGQQWIRATLVVSEIAFACVLLVGAGLLIRSFLRVLDVNLGFRPERAAAVRIDPSSQYTTQAKRNAYFDEVLRLVKSVPGIDAAGLTDVLPLGHNRSWSAGAKDQVYSKDHPPPDVFVRIVSDGYLKAMGIPLRSGRDLTERDSASSKPVMLINETLARSVWHGRDPIGQTATYVDVDRQVVGVVGDVRHLALEQGSGCEMYLPIRQTSDYSSVDLVVRTALPPAGLASAVRAALKPVEPNLSGSEFRTLQQLVDKAVSPRRFVVLLLAGFSGFALILASLGIYGVISYSVNQRTQEIGIRMALGASARDLQARIILQTLGLAAIGMLIGVTASWILTRALSMLLFGVTATDPVTFLAMLVILTGVAITAGYFPARRASRIDPMAALRAN
jgi:predicted permease